MAKPDMGMGMGMGMGMASTTVLVLDPTTIILRDQMCAYS